MQLSRWSTSEDDGDRKKQAEPEVQQATMQSDAPSRRRALRQALHPFSTCQESRPSLVSRTTPKYKVYAVPDTFVAKCASNTPITTPPPPLIIRVPCATGPKALPFAVSKSPTALKPPSFIDLNRCPRCIGFHLLEICHSRWPCTMCGGAAHHKILCMVVPRSLFSLDPLPILVSGDRTFRWSGM